MASERAERFVHQHDFGIVGKHARNRDPLFHSAGELMRDKHRQTAASRRAK